MRWLHISDIHFNFEGYDARNIQKKLIDKLKSLNLQMDFILITGDCLFKYGGTTDVIAYIKKIANVCKCQHRRVYICPGNHDIDRDNVSRNNLIRDIRDKKEDFSENYKNLCEIGHDRFQMIYKGVTTFDYIAYKVFSPPNVKYRTISIDSCLLSMDNTDCQKLRVMNEQLSKIGKEIKNDDKTNILIMHHGIECLELAESKKFEHWIEDSYIDMVCCGHTHRAAVYTYDDLRRDIKQFTAGAIIVDDYALPSFYICEQADGDNYVDMSLYTYTTKTEEWIIDNQLLRKFENGKYMYKLRRHEKRKKESNNNTEREMKSSRVEIKYKTTIDDFNMKYQNKYNSDKIYSNKHDGYERFNSWNIVHSLVDVGVSYEKTLEITSVVIETITSDVFNSINDVLSCDELRAVIFDSIIHFAPSSEESEFEIGRWASRYARKYNRKKETGVINKYGNREGLNYNYIKGTLLKNVIDAITNNRVFYEKIFRNELTRMSESIFDFLKNMEVFEIREEALIELVKEYITQKPHPWLVNGNREELISYHTEQGRIHLEELGEKTETVITQMEAAYHICAALLVQYDDYIGCTETSPITILSSTINNFTNKNHAPGFVLPMQKYQVVQMKKDFESHGISFDELKRNVNLLNKNIVTSQKISLEETREALRKLWGMLRELENEICESQQENIPIERIRNIFISAKGFVVKASLRNLINCFWVEPNWERYEISQQHLGKQILVCVLESIEDVKAIYKYLYNQSRRERITEIVFALSDYRMFTNEERRRIREVFQGKYLRCVFIQEENY